MAHQSAAMRASPSLAKVLQDMFTLDRTVWLAYGLSATIHVAVMAVLFWRSVPEPLWPPRGQVGIATSLQERADAPPQAEDVAVHAVPVTSSAEGRRVPVESSDGGAVAPDTPGLASYVRQTIDRQQRDMQAKSQDEQVRELESLGQELTRIGSAKSIGALSEALSGWLGVNERRSRPVEQPESPAEMFELSTSQISEVLREGEGDQTRYIAVLMDAQGRTRDVELDPAEGAELYRVFDLMKRFPLLEQLYRQTVMGLLDKLLVEESPSPPTGKPATASTKPLPPAPREEQAQQDD